MNFGVTGKPEGYYLSEQYRKSEAAGKSAGVSFAELAAARTAGKTAAQSNTSGLVQETSQYDVITHVGNADISPANWQRNDFPFWKYFQKDTSADALNDWRPVGANPPQTRGDLQRNYSSVGSGRIAILIPESLQEKMDA